MSASVRLQAEVNAFRAGRDTTKAAYTAAEQAADAVWAEMSRPPCGAGLRRADEVMCPSTAGPGYRTYQMLCGLDGH